MRSFTVLSFALLFTVAASAQESAAVAPAGPTGGILGGVVSASAVSGTPFFASSSVPMIPGGPVTGAPYSAEQTTEHIQTLADGTHITQPTQTIKLYRDSAGRTRTDRTAPLPPGPLGKGVDAPVFTDISDPVAGVRYMLESQSHTAHRVPMLVARPPQPPPANANSPAPNKTIRLLPAPLPPQSAATLPGQSSGPQFSRESLGTQTIQGVLAEGSRTTVTYPIGAIGNDKALVTTSETWISPQLKVVVLSKSSDPRSGDSTTQLTNISLAEPDAALFQVPPDYQIVDPQ